jgi:organic hydroperoxide reductase OsmC/OhrA
VARQPHVFEIDLARPDGSALLEAVGRPTIAGGAPPEFGGTGDVWSPEHLLLSSVALCFLTTLDFYARRAGLSFGDFRCHASGTVDKTPIGLAFTGVRLEAHAQVAPGDAARAREAMDKAEHGCLISSSLKCPVELVADVIERPGLEPTAPAA